MRQKIDAGSGLVAAGAAVLLISLFLDWYEPSATAWDAFESLDLVLAGLALAALAGALGAPAPLAALGRFLPALSIAALLVVASQLIDPPPAVAGEDRDLGAWLALACAMAMGIGSALLLSTISVTVDVRGRDRRRRVPAVDRREKAAPAGAAPTAAPAAEYAFDRDAREETAPAGEPTEATQAFDALDPAQDDEDAAGKPG